VPDALKKGAGAVISNGKPDVPAGSVLVKVGDTRVSLGKLAAEFYDHPDRSLRVIGVTGTNGKTTTTYILRSILERHGKKAGLIGTIVYEAGGDSFPAGRTTPEASDIEFMFRHSADAGEEYAVIEVSSHSLMLHRVDAIEFDQAIFTNLGLDHLDFHQTKEEYLKAKMKLFQGLDRPGAKKDKIAVVNLDDACAREIMDSTKARKITYGFSPAAQVSAVPLHMDMEKISFEMVTPAGKTDVNLKMTGKFNIYNALAAAASAIAEGIPIEEIKEGIESVANVPGRFEKIKGRGFYVIVDYAHTPEALKDLLIAARELAKKKLTVLFGCGGERDRSKRPIMGEIAASCSDLCILTSDNPRREDPLRIILDTESGIQKVKPMGEYYTFVDRREAIEKACSAAGQGDLVVIAGKGHEDYQILADKTIHFDDREVVREILKNS